MHKFHIQQHIINLENEALFLTLSGDPGYRVDISRIEEELAKLRNQLEDLSDG